MQDAILAIAGVCAALIGIGVFLRKVVALASAAIERWTAVRTLVNAQLRPNSGSSLVDRVQVTAESVTSATRGVDEVRRTLDRQGERIDRLAASFEGYRQESEKRNQAIDRTLGEILGTMDEMRRSGGR